MPKFAVPLLIFFIFFAGLLIFLKNKTGPNFATSYFVKQPIISPSPKPIFPLQIEAERQKQYSGSELIIEQTLEPGSNYQRFIASYKSDGLKIYGLLTVPISKKPEKGFPVIIFNHGYIAPEQYKTTERYVAYVDGFARNGYIIFKSDYRGNGNSEGEPLGAYYSDAYVSDVLNALSSLKKLSSKTEKTDLSLNAFPFPLVNPQKIGMWGHSMGGNITLRSMVISKDIKAGVIWGGVVGTYYDLMNNWQRKVPFRPSPSELALRNRNRQRITEEYGTPDKNPEFWHSIDPNFFLEDISGPIQLHHGESDEEVPLSFPQGLSSRLQGAGKTVEIFTYPGADHNISSPSFESAMERSIKFFDKHLK